MLSSILFNCQVVCDKWALEKKVSRTFFLVQLHKQNVYDVEVTRSFCEVIQIRNKSKHPLIVDQTVSSLGRDVAAENTQN